MTIEDYTGPTITAEEIAHGTAPITAATHTLLDLKALRDRSDQLFSEHKALTAHLAAGQNRLARIGNELEDIRADLHRIVNDLEGTYAY